MTARLQVNVHTFFGREHELIQSARAWFDQSGRTAQRVLSFGCSIGDEVASLRLFFPEAAVVGCDVNEVALESARRAVGHMSQIVVSDEKALAALGPFDLIVACSVLCLNPMPPDFAAAFPASRFDAALELLDGLLAPGGVLAIRNASYRFRDSPVSDRYDAIRSDLVWYNGHISVAGRSGEPILVSQNTPTGTPFHVRTPGFHVGEDEEMADALHLKRDSGERQVHTLRLAPPPDAFASEQVYRRINTDGLKTAPPGAIPITTTLAWGYDAGTGRKGTVTEISWPSLVTRGLIHRRPKVWRPL